MKDDLTIHINLKAHAFSLSVHAIGGVHIFRCLRMRLDFYSNSSFMALISSGQSIGLVTAFLAPRRLAILR